ncbi:hypothetical protein KY285_023071 [Solanum tuberosum]|nr:hypothetical protein KY285_023071 [Solanum tuberosum]
MKARRFCVQSCEESYGYYYSNSLSPFVEGISGGGLTYIGESEVEYVDPTTNNFVLVDNDFSFLNLIKDLGDGDFLDLYVQHVVDEVEVIKDGVPTGYLCGPTVGENVNEDGVENSHNINVDEGAQSENINVEVGIDDASDLESVETDWDTSNDSQEFAIPDDDDSEIDEELKTLRNERRTKLQRKKLVPTEEIILGVADVDRGFEDIGRNKAARYVGRLGGDEQYIDSSELDSDDSRDELDPEAVEGVDLPATRKSKKPGSSSQPASSSQPQSSRQPTGYSQPPSSSVGSSQLPNSRKPTSFSQPSSSGQPVGSSQPPTWRVQQAGRGRGRGKGKGRGRRGDDTSTVTGGQQAGRAGERVVTPVVFKCATPTNIDIGYKPRGLKWKGKDVVTTPQLQRMNKSKEGRSANV